MPRRMNRSVRALTTSVAFSFLLTRISKHSPLNSSRMFNVRKTLPSSVRWCTKSYDQTWSRYLGLSRTHDPSFNHRRPFLGCLLGTFSPSRFQSRSIRLSFTASQRHAGEWQHGDNRNGRTGAQAQSYLRPIVLRLLGPLECVAVLRDVV